MIKFIVFIIVMIPTVAWPQIVGEQLEGIRNPNNIAISPPPACTNKLDFSVPCNSQYIPLF